MKRPTLHLTQSELKEIAEYSCSLPDSYNRPLTEGGRRWRRRWPYEASDEDAIWHVGEYYRTPELDAQRMLGIIWYDVELREDGTPFRGRVGTYEIGPLKKLLYALLLLACTAVAGDHVERDANGKIVSTTQDGVKRDANGKIVETQTDPRTKRDPNGRIIFREEQQPKPKKP